MIGAPLIRIPRARLYLESPIGSGAFADCGRIDDASLILTGDPSITEDFDPLTCTKYEVDRDYLDVAGELSVQMVDGNSKNIARILGAEMQAIAAAVGKTYVSPATIADGAILSLGWMPAGSVIGGVFVPDAFTTAEDSTGTPVTLIEGQHYEWYEPANGILKVLDMTGLTAPLNFTGDSRASERVVVGDSLSSTYALMLVGVDQRNACTSERLHVWRASIQLGSAAMLSQALDNQDGQPQDITFDVTSDPTQAADPLLGDLGYWERA